MANLTTLVSFNGTDGANPASSLNTDANGDLFGTTTGGGANGVGAVFGRRAMRAIAAVLGACLALTPLAVHADELQVKVDAGMLVGLASRDGLVRSFKGVPYAAP